MPDGEVPFLDLRATHEAVQTELLAAAERVVTSGRYLLGPELEAFEDEFASAVGAAAAVGVGSGLDALVLGLRALGVGPGDEVIVPAQTFVATWFAVSTVGATSVPVDVTDDTASLDPSLLEAACTERTRAVVPVHLFGHPAPMDDIVTWARSRGVRVLADAAQAHGARLHGRPLGASGDAVAWSFYPSKNLGALGDGGAVTSEDPEVLDRVRRLRNYGSPVKHVHVEVGANSRLDELQAAFLRVKLRRLDEWNERRAAIAERYCAALGRLPLRLPATRPGANHAWHLFVVRTPARDHVRAHLQRRGVETGLHYPTTPYQLAAYAGLAIEPGRYPVAERWASECLSLPIGPHLADEQVDAVVAALAEAC